MSNHTLDEYQSSDAECPTCGRDDFASERGMKTHHARTHGESIAYKVSTCEWCEEDYNVKPHRFEDTRFCSTSCQQEWRYENLPREELPSWKGGEVKKECLVCGEAFTVKQFREESAKTCSYECSGVYRAREYNGSDSPHWRGGKSITDSVKKQLCDSAWKTVAEEYRQTTTRSCKMCGVGGDELDQKLDVHHIVPLSAGGNNGQYNLMCLCRSCHREVESYTRNVLEFDPLLVE